MPTNNPWDVPEREPIGDADPETIYASVGRALSRWERIEIYLAWLFLFLCNTQSSAAYYAYGSILAHGTRNDMIKAAAQAYFTHKPDGLDDTLKLLERVRKFAARRNEIAHGIVYKIDGSGQDLGHYLCPPGYSFNKRRLGDLWGRYAYTAKQIDLIIEHFMALGSEVFELNQKLRDQSSPPIFPEPEV